MDYKVIYYYSDLRKQKISITGKVKIEHIFDYENEYALEESNRVDYMPEEDGIDKCIYVKGMLRVVGNDNKLLGYVIEK